MKNKIASKYFIFFAILFAVSGHFSLIVEGADFKTTKEIKNFAQNELQNYGDIIFTVVPRGLVISVATDNIFPDGSAEITESSYELLKNIAKTVKYTSKPCVIEGNALTQKEGDEISNIELSIIRADKITEFFIKNCDIPPNLLRAIGFGEMLPFDDNVSYKGHLNKRIDFVILNYEAKR